MNQLLTHHNNTMQCNVLSSLSTYIKETSKVAEITDIFNNLRYTVQLSSNNISVDGQTILAYKIQVTNYIPSPAPSVIFERPEVGQPDITNYEYALKIYNECINNYATLINAELRDFQDIDALKERIGYNITSLSCCGTCKWCRSETYPYHHAFNAIERLKCINPLNQSTYPTCMPLDHIHENTIIFLNPHVNIFGLCPKYELKMI